MKEEEEVFTEEEDIECLEEPELEDTEGMDDNEEADPDWQYQLEENGGDDIDADVQEKESATVNIYQASCWISYWHWSLLNTSVCSREANIVIKHCSH